jgi:hypothetical protein
MVMVLESNGYGVESNGYWEGMGASSKEFAGMPREEG